MDLLACFAGGGDQNDGESDVLPLATFSIDMETACTQPCNAGADWLLSDQQNERALLLVYRHKHEYIMSKPAIG